MSFTKIATIYAPGGAHKHFLTYFLDRFSCKTPEIKELPFTSIGTSHRTKMLSGAFVPYHPSDTPPYFQTTTTRQILVKIEIKDLLFLERIVSRRAGDFQQNLNKDYIKLDKEYLELYQYKNLIKTLYGVDVDHNTEIPRFVFRDIKKMMFLNPIQNGYLIAQELYMKHLPRNCYLFPLETFWDKRKFFTEVKKLSDYMNLEIDLPYDAEIVHDAFINQIKEYQTRDRINRIVQALKNNKHYDISNLDTIEQAYLSAYIEKNNDFITIPLTNKFFKNTQDILAFLKYYPQHYKAMNPSLPTFNNIPNPFFLHNKQKNAKIKQ